MTVDEVRTPASLTSDMGTIGIRVVVLPRKADEKAAAEGDEIVDLTADETLVEEGSSPVGSYLERQKGGKLCCVFLVNGQRQDALDNSFIVQQLGFKYLRKRMMIIVDVDGLQPNALGELMLGSRQGFYRGTVWEAIHSRLIATLKGDPDLHRLEEDAEAEVAELRAGDQNVKEALDSLIESHHRFADHVVRGAGTEAGAEDADNGLGGGARIPQDATSLESPDRGNASGYPILVARPETTRMTLRPGVPRALTVTAVPENVWPALAALTYELDTRVPDLHISEDRSDDSVSLGLRFDPARDFDDDDYPVRTSLRVFARFNGVGDPRQLVIALKIGPATPPPPPVLRDEPTFLRVSTRQPVKIWKEIVDTHVRIRWDGKDELGLAPSPLWTFSARCLTPLTAATSTTFSQPRNGRFSLVIGLPPEVELGSKLEFVVVAHGPAEKTLETTFEALVAERQPRPAATPRLIASAVPTGASRRPPYDLRYIYRDDWDSGTNFGSDPWTAEDAGAYQDPTEKAPLVLLINNDMTALDEFRKYLSAKKLAENDVKMRLQKYTSHIAFHLYQMYQSTKSGAAPDEAGGEEDSPRQLGTEEQKAETHRVAMTLLKLMQVSR